MKHIFGCVKVKRNAFNVCPGLEKVNRLVSLQYFSTKVRSKIHNIKESPLELYLFPIIVHPVAKQINVNNGVANITVKK